MDGGVVVAIDVGGTTMKGALVDATGRTLSASSRDTAHPAPVAGVLEYAAELAGLAHRLTGRPAEAAGLVVPGVVEEERGIARYAANLGWRDLPLRDLAADRLGMPVALGHDVRAGALAEALFGAARGAADFLFLPIGTGIAGAMFLRGAPYAGGSGRGGEIGHAPVRLPPGLGVSERCACGQDDCLEVYASAAAVARRYAARGGTPGLAAPDVVALAAAGDRVAAEVWDEAVGALATALAAYAMILDPALVVVGGGLAGAGQALLRPLREQLAARLAWREPPPVVAGALGPSAGRLGAAILAWRAVGHDLTATPVPGMQPAATAEPSAPHTASPGPRTQPATTAEPGTPRTASPAPVAARTAVRGPGASPDRVPHPPAADRP